MARDFMKFLSHYGVIGLAIAVIIGGKLNSLVTSIVNDLLMPIVFQPALEAARVEDIRSLSYHGIFYGRALGAAIDFIIVAIIIYLMAKYVFKDENVLTKK